MSALSNYLEEAWLKTLRGGGNGVTYTAPAVIYVKLHTGAPGEDGTSNAAGETTRKAVSFDAPANPGGTMTSTTSAAWTNVSTTETITHISLWDHISASTNCLMVGALAASKAVNAGDNFSLPIGDIDITLA